jgi:hypothetical protein
MKGLTKELSSDQQAQEVAKKTMERMGKALDTAEEAFKKASDRFPSG